MTYDERVAASRDVRLSAGHRLHLAISAAFVCPGKVACPYQVLRHIDMAGLECPAGEST